MRWAKVARPPARGQLSFRMSSVQPEALDHHEHAHAAAAGAPVKRAYVQHIFSEIAPRYDLLNRVLSMGIDRAWRRVGLALDRVGFTVEDRDRAKGFYFVRYSDPEQDAARRAQNQGFFSRLFSFGNSANAKPEQYRVLVRDNKDTSQVQVLNGDGGREGSDNARRILALLHQQLK